MTKNTVRAYKPERGVIILVLVPTDEILILPIVYIEILILPPAIAGK